MYEPDIPDEFLSRIGAIGVEPIRGRIEKRGRDRTKCLADDIGREERIKGHIKRVAREMRRAKHRKHKADQHDAIRELCRHRDGTRQGINQSAHFVHAHGRHGR